jgi:hypothetical protein
LMALLSRPDLAGFFRYIALGHIVPTRSG